MALRLCLHCGQPTPEMRLGIRLTPLKTRLFDAIRRAGSDGITSDQLINELALPITRATLKAHVYQINELLAETDYRIIGRGGYRLTSRPIVCVALGQARSRRRAGRPRAPRWRP